MQSNRDNSRPFFWFLVAAMVFGCWTVVPESDAKEIRMVLFVQPELDLTGTEKIYIGPILVEPRAEQEARGMDRIASREFEAYLRRLLRRETRLDLLDPVEDLEVPSANPLVLFEAVDFWKALGEKSGAQYIVSASIDVDIRDRSGYETEEYVSPQDGKTYFRQILIEETGFEYDILVKVFDAATGVIVHSEQISDFQEQSERKLEVFTDMFDDLYTLENRLLGIFVPREIRAKRFLFH